MQSLNRIRSNRNDIHKDKDTFFTLHLEHKLLSVVPALHQKILQTVNGATEINKFVESNTGTSN